MVKIVCPGSINYLAIEKAINEMIAKVEREGPWRFAHSVPFDKEPGTENYKSFMLSFVNICNR